MGFYFFNSKFIAPNLVSLVAHSNSTIFYGLQAQNMTKLSVSDSQEAYYQPLESFLEASSKNLNEVCYHATNTTVPRTVIVHFSNVRHLTIT